MQFRSYQASRPWIWITLLGTAFLVGMPATQARASTEDHPVSQVLARFENGVVTQDDFDRFVLGLPVPRRRPSAPDGFDAWRRGLLEELLVEELLAREAEEERLVARAPYRNTLLRGRQDILAEAMLGAVNREVSAVSEEEVRTYYDTNPDLFTRDAAILARHIFIEADTQSADRATARRRIEEMREQIIAGTDLAELARQCSDSENAADGGLLPWRRKGSLNPDFEEAAWKLQPGELSAVVETDWGFHLIKLEGRQETGLMLFEEVRLRIRSQLEQERVTDAEMTLMAELAREMGLHSPDPLLRARQSGDNRLLAQAARARGLHKKEDIQTNMERLLRRTRINAARQTRLHAWAAQIPEDTLRAFHATRQAHYRRPHLYDVTVVRLLFEEDVPQMLIKERAEEAARRLRALGTVRPVNTRPQELRRLYQVDDDLVPGFSKTPFGHRQDNLERERAAIEDLPRTRVFALLNVTPQRLARRTSREMAAALRDLEAGDVSQPVPLKRYDSSRLREERHGYQVLRLDRKHPGVTLQYEQARRHVREDYIKRNMAAFRQHLKDTLFEEYDVTLLLAESTTSAQLD